MARIRNCIEILQEYLQQHKHCYLCRQASKDLVCEACVKDTLLTHLPVPGFDILMQPKLAEHLVTPYYHHFYALGEYAGILKILINRLKFGNNPLAAEVLAQFFMSVIYPRISQLDDLPELLVPIPLSMWRYVGREYNQARLLAQSVSKLSNIPVAECLIRSRHTSAQSQLDREARLANIDNAFAINQPIQSNHIALIDDVVTTGATVNSACRTIVKHYPDMRISIWSMAVTPSKKTS
ncbi:ComF family protein [Glaciecola sp. SC05]|uniref:ComF family protein n=1 Tax=Glaciecola sp. SC05 TaxID=1987355 RepID=UPI003528A51B